MISVLTQHEIIYVGGGGEEIRRNFSAYLNLVAFMGVVVGMSIFVCGGILLGFGIKGLINYSSQNNQENNKEAIDQINKLKWKNETNTAQYK